MFKSPHPTLPRFYFHLRWSFLFQILVAIQVQFPDNFYLQTEAVQLQPALGIVFLSFSPEGGRATSAGSEAQQLQSFGFHPILSHLAQRFSSYLILSCSVVFILSCSLVFILSFLILLIGTSYQFTKVFCLQNEVCAQMQPEPFSQEQKDTFLRMWEART